MYALHYYFCMPSLVQVIRHFATENSLFPPPVTFETHKEAPASCFYFVSSLAIFHCSIVVQSCLVCSASFFFFPLQIYFLTKCPKGAVLLFVLFFINIIIIYYYGYYYFILHKKLITSFFIIFFISLFWQ